MNRETQTQDNPQEAKAHTPLPWRSNGTHRGYMVFSDPPNGPQQDVAGRIYNPANAAFIVRACNSHAELLEALEALGTAAAAFLLLLDDYDFPTEPPAQKEAAALDDAIGVASTARARARGESDA